MASKHPPSSEMMQLWSSMESSFFLGHKSPLKALADIEKLKNETRKKKYFAFINRCQAKGKFCDLILKHEEGEFKVHRTIVCPKSKVIDKACNGGFKESSTGVFEMIDISYFDLERLVYYFYHDEYEADLGAAMKTIGEHRIDSALVSPEALEYAISRFKVALEVEEEEPQLQLHSRMFALGDRYDIRDLRKCAAGNFGNNLGRAGSNELLQSVYGIYEGTAPSMRALRDLVSKEVRKRLREIHKDKDTDATYYKICDDVPDFRKDLLDIFVAESPSEPKCETIRDFTLASLADSCLEQLAAFLTRAA